MGRPRRYRQRLRFEIGSVQAKGMDATIRRILQRDFGCSRVEAEVLAARSKEWLAALGVAVAGRVQVSVPATRSRRYASQRRCVVTITAVDVSEDGEVWCRYGLAAMQRRRLWRWCYEIYRQGGWPCLTEVAAWANMTPATLEVRLKALRRLGIWLPHVGGPAASDDQLALEPWLLARYLEGEPTEPLRARLGLGLGAWEDILRHFVMVLEASGTSEAELADKLGRSRLEIAEMRHLADRYRHHQSLRDLLASYGSQPGRDGGLPEGIIEVELERHYGFSPLAARLYRQWLTELAAKIRTEPLEPGEMIFWAISADEGPRARLDEAKCLPVRLLYLTAEDVREHDEHPTRVSALKFGRIQRYATQARAQGALLTLPDLAMLLGIHTDAIRRQIAAHPEVVVPTRGRIKDIGRGVSHRTEIVELYLQMHTETEIVDRTGHSYQSVESYLREFARVVALADRGLNPVMIRRIIGRSMNLVKAYLELYRRYDQPDYQFRLAQLRNVFARDEIRGKKGVPGFLYPTGGIKR